MNGAPLYTSPVVLLIGYDQMYNPERNYKLGKQPIPACTGWTSAGYRNPSPDIIKSHLERGGWIGRRVPEGQHALDIEDPEAIKLVRAVCEHHGIKPPINHTNNGLQFIFSTNGGPPLTGSSNRLTRLGFPVTDRAAGANYLISPPILDRTWENPNALKCPPVIPDELLPARNIIDDVAKELAWELGAAYRAGHLAGYQDLDAALMGFCVEIGMGEELVLELFRLVFMKAYSDIQTVRMLRRAKDRREKGDDIVGTGSLINTLKDKGLEKIIPVIQKIERLAGKKAPVNGDNAKKSKTDKLIMLGLSAFEFFHDRDLKAYAIIKRDNHYETYPLKSKAFRTCLSGLYWSKYQEGVGGQIVQDALGTLEGHAIHGGPCQEVHVRLAEAAGAIFLDLGNERYEVVEITADGWRVRDSQNVVKFRRPSGMAVLPYPKEGGDVGLLRKYINLSNPDDWPVLVGFILMCFNPWGPYPILSFTGEQGSAKSTGQKVIKAITDPSTAPLRSLPKEVRDLAITSMHAHVLAYDNLSVIPSCMSDAFCRQATGSGFATRTLYSDDEETIINTRRPIMMNGISNVVSRHDLADRTVIINMAVIPEERRIAEADFWREFDDDTPEILGGILDAVSCARRNYKDVRLPKVPRMADFTIWVTAAEPALGWDDGTFIHAYEKNRKEVNALTLDADIVGTAVKELMETRNFVPWEGKATDLLKELENHVEDRITKDKKWPKAGNALSAKLQRAATALRADGIDVVFAGRSGDKRLIHIRKAGEKIVTIVIDHEKEVQKRDINRN